MTTQLPGNLKDIFPLRFRLRNEMRFFRAGDRVVAQRVSDSQRFFLQRWQYEMFRRFDGKHTFEEASREVYEIVNGGFTAVGLLNLYNWLYQENLVVCECDSVFELVRDESDETETAPRQGAAATAEKVEAHHADPEKQSKIARPDFTGVGTMVEATRSRKLWMNQGVRVAAIVLFSLAVLRLSYVIAPVFEPPVDRVYAKVEKFFYEGAGDGGNRNAERTVPESPKKEVGAREVAVASKVDFGAGESVPPEAVHPEQLHVEDPPPIEFPIEFPIAEEPSAPEISIDYLESLRRRLSECRIRRDEFYIQNDEKGYRREVEKMTNLAREIGEIEARL